MNDSGRFDDDDLDDPGLVDAIYDALDRGDPEQAEAMARRALGRPDGEDPVVRFLAGVAQMELGSAAEAIEDLRRAVDADPDDPEFRTCLARALFQACRFREASREVERVLGSDPDFAEALAVRSALHERAGAWSEADRDLEAAARLDPERFARPTRLTREEFEREVVASGERLPARFRRHLSEVAVTVEDLPSDELLRGGDPPLDPEILGLFVGVALPERSAFSAGGELPPRILLFQRNLERDVRGPDELREQIAVTLYHELGHYLGFDEDGLEDLDLA